MSDNNSSNNSYPTASSMQQNRVIDQISINVRTNMKAKDITGSEDNSLFYHVEDELRSSILQLSLLDVNMDKLPNCKLLHIICYDTVLFIIPRISESSILSFPALNFLTLSCITLPCLSSLPFLTFPPIPSIPYLTLPYLTLPYLTLPYLTLPYLTLPYLSSLSSPTSPPLPIPHYLPFPFSPLLPYSPIIPPHVL